MAGKSRTPRTVFKQKKPGRPAKVAKAPPIELNPFDQDESINITMGAKVAKPAKAESSIPIGSLKKATKGLQPRSRAAFSREASFRNKQDRIDYYTQNFARARKGKTYVPPETYPEGYTFMWARSSVRQYDEKKNLANLEANGWEYVTGDMMPELAYQDAHSHGVGDNNDLVTLPGLVGMIRLVEIHNAELREFAKERDRASQMKDTLRTIDSDLHPFTTGSLANNERFFPSDNMANSFQNSFANL